MLGRGTTPGFAPSPTRDQGHIAPLKPTNDTQNKLPSIPSSFLTRTPMPPDDPGSSTGLITRIFITRSGSGIKARKAHGPEVNLLLERINNSATSV